MRRIRISKMIVWLLIVGAVIGFAAGVKGVLALFSISVLVFVFDLVGRKLKKPDTAMDSEKMILDDEDTKLGDVKSDSEDLSCTSVTNQDYYWYYDK